MLWPQDALGRVDVGTSAAFSFDAGFLLFGCSGGLPSVPDGCCIMLYPALHKLDSRLSIRFLQGIVVAQWIQLQSIATVRPVQHRNLCHTASTYTEGG